MKISALLERPSVRILLFLHERGEVRYTDLTDLITSRGTLSLNLEELSEESLIERRVVATKPVQAHYSLTHKGKEVAAHFDKVRKTLQSAST